MQKIANTTIILLIVLLVFQLSKCFKKSEYCNCVIVKQESDFIGKWLKHKNSLKFATIKTVNCAAFDTKIDNGDGERKGKVRWATCYAGPDCDEAGMF